MLVDLLFVPLAHEIGLEVHVDLLLLYVLAHNFHQDPLVTIELVPDIECIFECHIQFLVHAQILHILQESHQVLSTLNVDLVMVHTVAEQEQQFVDVRNCQFYYQVVILFLLVVITLYLRYLVEFDLLHRSYFSVVMNDSIVRNN